MIFKEIIFWHTHCLSCYRKAHTSVYANFTPLAPRRTSGAKIMKTLSKLVWPAVFAASALISVSANAAPLEITATAPTWSNTRAAPMQEPRKPQQWAPCSPDSPREEIPSSNGEVPHKAPPFKRRQPEIQPQPRKLLNAPPCRAAPEEQPPKTALPDTSLPVFLTSRVIRPAHFRLPAPPGQAIPVSHQAPRHNLSVSDCCQ